MKLSSSIGVIGAAYALPKQCLPVRELVTSGLVHSSEGSLQSFGFEHAFIAQGAEELYTLLLRSAREVLAASRDLVPASDVAAVIIYTGVPDDTAFRGPPDLRIFEYVLPRLVHDLGLGSARAYALSQQGCSGLMSAVELASDILASSDKRAVLCVMGDRIPSGHSREVIYNVISDAAGALLIHKDSTKNHVLSIHHASNAALWNTAEMEDQILATYFPMAARAIQDALREAQLDAADIAWFVPHNVSARSWEILARLIPIPLERIWLNNVARVGHTVSCDHVINLSDMEDAGLLKTGDRLFCFTFGFGAQWSSMILQH